MKVHVMLIVATFVFAFLGGAPKSGSCMQRLTDEELARVVGGTGVAGPCRDVNTNANRPVSCESHPCTAGCPDKTAGNDCEVNCAVYDCFARTRVAYNTCADPGNAGSCTQVRKECARWWGFNPLANCNIGQCDFTDPTVDHEIVCSEYDTNGCNP
ncbi:MAG: hypothetical protein COZ06_20505 [Armatimonadetes bacterium CG_4_10_14_3_um_filter_66_18]|nr:hypothetical protein [Armatimonadota bacterium]PIU89813.1 MAG: hypothetical protein COS65_27245 [Armatimonadetes bacterium CG06_land_8_20_14_3_00_66_21]PIX46816.1 MAG: hypothetical protein COZ57_10205 [Armatimonadetes bacterium CG_4_8_14_3_um_filter_66_20]PIY44469.1 MAG: hypothetical protein COZ06_20505 [Armatimonadetes bacterium CG_4_10_14_3_um_filter_66_18]PIZ31063.1 MAG: hypothetical protein COY42_33195 [Armatimonadetes bacterium CG_4_10_14_0_8_um_filter_66_14]PJB68831.1 MAG: hypothetica